MKVQYQSTIDGSEANFYIVADTDLDRQLLRKLQSDYSVTTVRATTGGRHLLEIRRVRRETINVNASTATP